MTANPTSHETSVIANRGFTANPTSHETGFEANLGFTANPAIDMKQASKQTWDSQQTLPVVKPCKPCHNEPP